MIDKRAVTVKSDTRRSNDEQLRPIPFIAHAYKRLEQKLFISQFSEQLLLKTRNPRHRNAGLRQSRIKIAPSPDKKPNLSSPSNPANNKNEFFRTTALRKTASLRSNLPSQVLNRKLLLQPGGSLDNNSNHSLNPYRGASDELNFHPGTSISTPSFHFPSARESLKSREIPIVSPSARARLELRVAARRGDAASSPASR